MRRPFTVLFACVGNVCRSPLAARILRERLRERLGEAAEDVVVESAGVRALTGHRMDELAARELARLGLTDELFTARQLTAQMVGDADLVLAATKDLRSRVLEEAPVALRRTFTITEFAALVEGANADSPQDLVADAAQRRSSAQVDDYDVADPVGLGADMYREVAELIDASVSSIAEVIAEAVQRSLRTV
jgi:protein-tyrosine phosphatase